MQTTIKENIVTQKTRELCQAILEQEDFQSIRQRVDNFMADSKAQAQYESLSRKGEQLHEKQHQGLPLSDAEVKAFEDERDTFLKNPVARGFLNAQEEMHEIQSGVKKYVSKTLELGRLPEDYELEEGGSCGSGCGCHSH